MGFPWPIYIKSQYWISCQIYFRFQHPIYFVSFTWYFKILQNFCKPDKIPDIYFYDALLSVGNSSEKRINKVAVENQYSSLPRDSSTFYIDSNPEKESQKAIRIIQIEDDGNIIAKDAIVEGQSKYVTIYGQIANKFRKNVRVMESEINEFFKGLQNLTEDEQIKQLERQLDRILAEIEKLSVQMKHKLETEILPRMKEQIEELRRKLEQIGKGGKLKYVDQKIETILAKL